MPPRKTVEGLTEASLRAFGPGDDVALILKDNLEIASYRSGWPERLRALAARTDIPPIRYVDTAYRDADMARLFRTATALVHPYRGEGVALPVLEAMACGTPVVVTRGGATDDFVDASVGALLPAGCRGAGRGRMRRHSRPGGPPNCWPNRRARPRRTATRSAGMPTTSARAAARTACSTSCSCGCASSTRSSSNSTAATASAV